MLDTVQTLCNLSGVSGFEDEVRDYILERVLPHIDSVTSDSMGNLIVTKKGAKSGGPKILVCAHMDEIGLIVTAAGDDGCLRFDCVGGIDRRVLIGKRVYIGKNRVPGVLGIKAYHLVDKEDEKKVPKLDDMYIDIGMATKEAALKLVSLGDPCVFSESVVEFGEGCLKAKALDDRIGCAAMIKLIESELPCDCVFAFTVQEEVGLRGAMVVANRLAPDIAVILEGTTAADLPEVPEGKKICRLGGGLVIPFMDRGAIYNPALYEKATELADANGIAWQTKSLIAGATDAAAIQRSGAGARVISVAAPVRSIHSPVSVAKISDFETMPRFAALLLEALASDC